MRYLNLAIVGGISFAAGLLVGLSIAVICQVDRLELSQAIAERDAAKQKAAETQAAWNDDARQLEAALKKARAEITRVEGANKKFVSDWFAERNQPPPSPPPPPDNRRHLVTVKGEKSTDTFRINTSKWRLSWEFVHSDYPDCDSVLASVYRANGDLVTSISGTTDDDSIIRAAPGDFYLDVASSDVRVTFWAEEIEPGKPEQATETIAPWRETKHKPIRTAPW